MTLPGWPFDEPPLRHGVVEGIRWAITGGGIPQRPTVNGYAHIPEEHPWSTIDWKDLDDRICVHGGVTFGPGLSLFKDGGWIGFDTSHAADTWTDEALAEAGIVREVTDYDWIFPAYTHEHMWTVDKVEQEAKDLARQIAEARS